ncbi:MAG TPA: N-acetylmuramoyl-L-alanine amidase [Thermoleophilaceae bacterium]|nr:N-acetylmuramoyl-L-alanine amidase [Thermoleophilaceae bacterium]
MRAVSALGVVWLALVVGASATAPPSHAAGAPIVVGRTVGDLPIRAWRVGAVADRVVLVVGEIHGNEPAGRAIARRLRATRLPPGVTLMLVDSANPDGGRAGARWNGHGVDLNRNFPFRWRPIGAPFDTYHSGQAPLSEPESSALAALIRRVRPRVTVWYHQHLRLVDRSGGDPYLEQLYARRSRLPYRRIAPLPGTATSWQNSIYPRDSAFVVELPAGRLDRLSVGRHAAAVVGLARAIAPPRVVQTPIPYGPRRRREMRAYSKRHYGIEDHRLRSPRVIVEHYTASNSFSAAFDTFAADTPDVELGELPGVCAHYLIDRDGTVHQLAPTAIMCRHTVGLNWTAIGIEHVGVGDAQVMANRRQRVASLRLTRMLQGRHRITTRNVIGHAESLSSPFHRERIGRFRGQTHGDFSHSTMRRYRDLLGRMAAPDSLR